MDGPSTPKPRIVVFSRSSDRPALIEPLQRGLRSASEIDFRIVSRPSDLGPLIDGAARVIVFSNCLMKEDIADLYNFLPQVSARVEEGTLRILVLNSIGHPRLGSLLRSRAPVEVVEFPTNLKAIQYKLKSALTSVHQSYQRAAAARARTEPTLETDPALGTKTRAARAKAKTAGQEVLWQSPREFPADFWWILGRKNIRNVVGVWLIDLLGPGPVVGAWEEVPGVERSGGVEHPGEKAWAWRPRSASADPFFHPPGGRWIFFGKQPEFSWQKNLWSFVSKHPMLAFYPDGSDSPDYVRIEYRPEEGLRFLENSDLTKGLLRKIESTFESRLGGHGEGETEVEEVEGDFGGWDFPIEEGGSGSTTAIEPDEEGGVDWKDHTGAKGVEIGSRDLRVPTERPRGIRSARSALSPDESLGGKLGLGSVDSPGIGAGSDAFDRIEIRVEALRKNGERLGSAPGILLYEINESGSILFVRDLECRLGDRFVLRYDLESGGQKMSCAMEWELTSLDLTLEDGVLAAGSFRSGDFDPLFILLDRLDARKKELKDFYSAARD